MSTLYGNTICCHNTVNTYNKKAQLSLTNPHNAVEIRVMGHSRALKVTPFIACLWFPISIL